MLRDDIYHLDMQLTKLGGEKNELFTKLVNRIISVNHIVGRHKENIPLLEDRLKNLIRDRNSSTATICCHIIEKLLDSWLRSGTVYDHMDRIVFMVDQLNSLATVADKLPIQVDL